jgi:hypothetical protein
VIPLLQPKLAGQQLKGSQEACLLGQGELAGLFACSLNLCECEVIDPVDGQAASRVRVGFAGVGQLVPGIGGPRLLRWCVVIVFWQPTKRTETPMASPEPYLPMAGRIRRRQLLPCGKNGETFEATNGSTGLATN